MGVVVPLHAARHVPPRRALQAFLVTVLCLAAACNRAGPSPPPIALSCPVPITLEATQPGGAMATFAPTPSGGRAPHSVACAPASGAIFPTGQTAVACSVTDAEQRQASCQFTIQVRVSQALLKTRFLAFGDSITEGQVSPPLSLLADEDSYPFKLQQMLRSRYPSQDIVVLNRGRGGERLQRGAERLPGVLDADRPEVLLLLEGIVNVRNTSTETSRRHLTTMLSDAKARGVEVIVATVMPVGAGLEEDEPGINAAVAKLNVEIGKLAQQFGLGAPVDLYSLFNAQPHLIGRDDLHPTADGFTRIAEMFNDAIVDRYHNSAP